MIEDSVDLENRREITISYFSIKDHFKRIIKTEYKTLFIRFIGSITIFWLIIGVGSFYYPKSILSNNYVLYFVIIISLVLSIINSLRHYFNKPIKGLGNVDSEVHKIALVRRRYWNFKLIAVILKNKLFDIDRELDNVINNRKYIEIKRRLCLSDYLIWIDLRPAKFRNLFIILKQLIEIDLFNALNFDENNEKKSFNELVNTTNLIQEFYSELYKFEIEEKEMIIPEIAEKLNSYQMSWVPMIKDNINQVITELAEIGNRKRKDKSQIKIKLVLESPDNIDDFIEELKRLRNLNTVEY